VRVKVCGITRYEDARLALDRGAWAVGFVFWPRSPRRVDAGQAAAIVRRLPPETLAVGVFVDAPIEEVRETAAVVGLRGIQLHGSEPPSYASSLGVGTVIKAFRVGPDFDDRSIDGYPDCLVLLDAGRPGAPGGTGCAFDWSVARKVQERRPIILAGGLTPENVRAAIDEVRPEGVDVASGVEARPGEKDPVKLEKFFAEIADT